MKPTRILTIFFLFAISFKGLSNAAMPGVWQGGAGARFVPLFPSDSAALQSISMQREEVLVHLYNGYAVVKGTYWMRNRSEKPVSIVVGYPLQGTVDAPIVNHINLGEPRALKVLINGLSVETVKGDAGISGLLDTSPNYAQFDPGKWILWRTAFAPASITTITVYFLVNCSDARLRKGYNVKKGHAFAYVLESGTAWVGSIDTGSIKIKLQDGVQIKQVKGLLPATVWQSNNNLLTWQFNKLEPGPNSNVLVWYNVGKDSIHFESDVLPRSTELFAAIDNFDRLGFAGAAQWPFLQKDDLSADNGFLFAMAGGFTLLFIVPVAIIAGLLLYWRRLSKRRKEELNHD